MYDLLPMGNKSYNLAYTLVIWNIVPYDQTLNYLSIYKNYNLFSKRTCNETIDALTFPK